MRASKLNGFSGAKTMIKRLVVLQHGSHGTHMDLGCVSQCLEALDPSTVVWQTGCNERHFTDDGIIPCGERLASDLMDEIRNLCSAPQSSDNGDDMGGEEPVLHISFICYSMGGLIVREALPRLYSAIEREEDKLQVEWKMYCTIATPHLGVRQMPSPIRYYVGRLLAYVYSTSYGDMFLHSNVLTERLLSERHLACLAAFKRRLVVSSVNDILVPLLSSGLMLPPSEREPQDGVQKNDEKNFCAFTEDEMRDKLVRITEVREDQWHTNRFPEERKMAMTLLQGAGSFDSIVVDLRRPDLDEVYRDGDSRKALAYRGAHKRSHQAIVCKPPMNEVEEAFRFVSQMVAKEVLAAFLDE
uniref:Uncharacterized protein TCIL3000_11_12340 n=1 Tax=Trypanosoma congolense (strain IL3000) TaxID=1068625 RepID=G0V269_TRYCI|nr:unnamed protein product [Trypanosoma congolense IL3000]